MPKSKSKKRDPGSGPEFSLCTVNSVGPATDASSIPSPGVYVNLTETKPTNGHVQIWFYAADGGQDQLLSVAIAAISTGKNVWAWVDWGARSPSVVTRMYLDRPDLLVQKK